MTAPVTFPSDEVDSYRANREAMGRWRYAERVAVEVARGSWSAALVSMMQKHRSQELGAYSS